MFDYSCSLQHYNYCTGVLHQFPILKIRLHKLSIKVTSLQSQEHEEDLISTETSEMFMVTL